VTSATEQARKESWSARDEGPSIVPGQPGWPRNTARRRS